MTVYLIVQLVQLEATLKHLHKSSFLKHLTDRDIFCDFRLDVVICCVTIATTDLPNSRMLPRLGLVER